MFAYIETYCVVGLVPQPTEMSQIVNIVSSRLGVGVRQPLSTPLKQVTSFQRNFGR